MPVADLSALLRSLEPRLQEGRYAFATLGPGGAPAPADVVASVREAEGLSVVVTEEVARRERLAVAFLAEWITLTVHSDLNAVGLTAAFARALADAGIGCNVIAGVHHDHLFVPAGRGLEAVAVLRALQERAG
jgi:hypothetical protein